MAVADVEALRTQIGALASAPELDPAERVAGLRRLRSLSELALDQARESLRQQLDLCATLTTLIGQADSYIGSNELQRESGAMERALALAGLRENADLREQLGRQGMEPDQLDRMGLHSHDDLDVMEADGGIEEAAFGLAANFREALVRRGRGKAAGQFAEKPGTMPSAKGRGGKKLQPPGSVKKPAPAKPSAAKPAAPQSPGVLGMGSISRERMEAVDEAMRTMVQPGEDEKVEQHFSGPEELFKTAEADNPEFEKLLSAAVASLGGAMTPMDEAVALATEGTDKPMMVMGPMKKMERAKEKVDTKYKGDWNRLQDVIRATMVVPSLDHMPGALEAIRRQAEAMGWQVKKAENRFLDPPPPHNTGPTGAGYRDAAVALVSPNGSVTELQMNTGAMFSAKQSEGHEFYKESRTIEAAIETRGDEEGTPEELAELARIRVASKRLYQSAWEKSYAAAA